MQNLRGVNGNKEKILATIRLKGPSLPVQIAMAIGLSPLFASAFLSELKAEGKLKISSMRVGSSPLYFLPGQEEMLENFHEHLNQREREAFSLLREKKVLEDEKQEPVVRVALRAIKDFAVSMRIRIKEESKLFWKYFSVNDEEVRMLLSGKGKAKAPSTSKQAEDVVKGNVNASQGVEEVVSPGVSDKIPVEPRESSRQILTVKREKKIQESGFSKNVKDYLAGKDIEVLEILAEKKRGFEARVRIDTMFGKQEYYLVAKDKKSFTDNDLAVALQKAQAVRLPALGMSSGELNKKGREYLGDWGNLVKFEKLNF